MALLLTACHPGQERQLSPLALNVTAEGLLFGGDPCALDKDCASNVCMMERCLGFITTSSWPGRAPIRMAIHAALADPVILHGIRDTATAVLGDPEADPIVRGRAALALGELPLDDVREPLSRALQNPDEAIRFFAAAALYRAGDPTGGTALRSWAGHPTEAIRSLSAALLDEGPRNVQKFEDDSTR